MLAPPFPRFDSCLCRSELPGRVGTSRAVTRLCIFLIRLLLDLVSLPLLISALVRGSCTSGTSVPIRNSMRGQGLIYYLCCTPGPYMKYAIIAILKFRVILSSPISIRGTRGVFVRPVRGAETSAALRLTFFYVTTFSVPSL